MLQIVGTGYRDEEIERHFFLLTVAIIKNDCYSLSILQIQRNADRFHFFTSEISGQPNEDLVQHTIKIHFPKGQYHKIKLTG